MDNVISASHKGKRESNQDVVTIVELNNGTTLYMIVDGMGGYKNGDVAARLVSETFITYFRSVKVYSKNEISSAIKKANLAIKQYNDNEQCKSGATLGGMLLDGLSAKIFWVGDVEISVFKEKALLFRTEAHNLVNQLKKELSVVSSEIIRKYQHVVTQSISGKRVVIDFGYQEFQNIDYSSIVISSDGVQNEVDTSLFLEYDIFEIEKRLSLTAKDNYSYIFIK